MGDFLRRMDFFRLAKNYSIGENMLHKKKGFTKISLSRNDKSSTHASFVIQQVHSRISHL